jgi:molybdopterin/thiamine biosynthesis adenylyltransferase
MPEAKTFDYNEAFSRTLGWISESEREILRSKRVAIAGLGGVGGLHFITLVRLGVTKFNVAELDQVELANFNRQVCASVSTLGKDKIEVMRDLGLDINPELDLKLFPQGVTEENIEDFLHDVDLYVDGIDFFELDIRRRLFEVCARKKIPAMTTAPMGMGAAHINFMPGKMTFEEYFRISDVKEEDKYIQFLAGLSPAMLQRNYIVDFSRVDFLKRKVPSTPMGCFLCTGVVGTEALKILLGRPGVSAAPASFQFDAYRSRFKKVRLMSGNRSWRQRVLFSILRRQLRK